MEKKLHKCQNENPKNSKKIKEIKLLTNYIPKKKFNAQSHISEYETEISLQNNFSNKYQKERANIQIQSIQKTQPNLINLQTNQNKDNMNYSKEMMLSIYNIDTSNNANLYEYFNEKVTLTQNKLLSYKNNKIKNLEKELSLIKQELNFYGNRKTINRIHKDQKKCNSCDTKDRYQKNINKEKNNKNICAPLQTFSNNDILSNFERMDKNIDKHLTNLLTENGSYTPFKNKKLSQNKESENNSNVINFLCQSKTGYNNWLIHENISEKWSNNGNKKKAKINVKKKNVFKMNHVDKNIKQNDYVYSNKRNEKQIQIVDSNNIIKDNFTEDSSLEDKYAYFNTKFDKLFTEFFDYYYNKSK